MLNKTILALIFLSGCAHLPNANGSCPADFPIKGNESSLLYHMPDSTYYFLTNAEWCFKTEEAAKDMGYRVFKNNQND